MQELMNLLLPMKPLLFPADELYGSNWDTRWVDPFRGGAKVEMPDSCAIDCSTFILPYRYNDARYL